MEIETRIIDKYINLKIKADSTVVDLGIMDTTEAMGLLEHLMEVSESLRSFIDKQLPRANPKEDL